MTSDVIFIKISKDGLLVKQQCQLEWPYDQYRALTHSIVPPCTTSSRRSWMMLVLCRKGEANANKSSNSVAAL